MLSFICSARSIRTVSTTSKARSTAMPNRWNATKRQCQVASFRALPERRASTSFLSTTLPRHDVTLQDSSIPKDDILSNVVGGMDHDDFQKARGRVVQLSKSGNAQGAQDLLDQLVLSSLENPQHKVNQTLYNVCLNAWSGRDATKALELLSKMKRRYELHPLICVWPDTISYNSVLHAHAMISNTENENNTTSNHRQQVVEDLILEMEEHPLVQPDTQSYNLVMLYYANRAHAHGFAQKAEDVLLNLSKKATTQDIQPDTASFNTVLKAWSNAVVEGAPQRAFEILTFMIRLHKEHGNCRPNHISFQTVARAFCKLRSTTGARQALQVLRQGQALNVQKVDMTFCLNQVLLAWAWSGNDHAGQHAEALLQEFVLQQEQGDTSVRVTPDVYSYTACVDAHAASSGPQEATDFLQTMIAAHHAGEIHVAPNTVTFNRAIYAWVSNKHKSNATNAARQANDLLVQMDLVADKSKSDCRPDASTYNMCIDACPKTSDGSTQALALLDRAEQANIHLGSFAYNAVIKGLANSHYKGATSKAIQVLERMERISKGNENDSVHPDSITYNIVLDALAKNARHVRLAGLKALEILNRMEEAYQTQGNQAVEPCAVSYTCVLQTWANTRAHGKHRRQKLRVAFDLMERMQQLDRDADRFLTLDTTACRTMLFVLADCSGNFNDTDLGEYAHGILKQMECEYRAGNEKLRPDCSCYSACIVAMARSSLEREETQNQQMATESKAHKLLQETVEKYQRGELDRLAKRCVFVEVIHEYAKRSDAITCRHAFQVIKLMERVSRNDKTLEPDAAMYSIMIDMLVQSGHNGAPQEAHELLRFMEKKRQEGHWRTGSDRIAWNSVVHSWAKSNHPRKAQHARQLLDEMKEMPVGPDTVTYNTVLNAAAFTGDENKQEALRIALDTFQDLEQSFSYQPDHITYGTMVKVYKYLLADTKERENAIVSMFRQACGAGQVGKMIVREVIAILPVQQLSTDVVTQLDGYSAERHRQCLPREWTCNLRER